MMLRPAARADLDAILGIQAASYPPELIESRAVFSAILEAGAGLCFVACNDEEVCGYLLAHPSTADRVPLLHAAPPPRDGNTIFLHDMAVLPALRGTGVGASLWRALWNRRSGQQRCQLVSVGGSRGFWERMGFREITRVRMSPAERENYGEARCCFMEEW